MPALSQDVRPAGALRALGDDVAHGRVYSLSRVYEAELPFGSCPKLYDMMRVLEGGRTLREDTAATLDAIEARA